MADIWSKAKRSEVMSKVRSKNNKSTEQALISLFKYFEIKGWRRNYKVKGKPDFVFLKEKVAVFADGCFWHGHDCRVFHPKTNEQYWLSKLEKNRQHDMEVTMHLQKLGWNVVRVWECEIKKGRAIQKIAEALGNRSVDVTDFDEFIENTYNADYFLDDIYFDVNFCDTDE